MSSPEAFFEISNGYLSTREREMRSGDFCDYEICSAGRKNARRGKRAF